MGKAKKILLISLISILFILFLIFHFVNNISINTFSLVYISTSLIFLVISLLIFKVELKFKEVAIITALGLLIRFSFINTEPVGSEDIYRYIWDGKVQANSINPYLYTANDSALVDLHSEILPSKLNFAHMKTIYFPLSQWFFYIGYTLSGEDVWGYKLLLFIAELLTIIFLYFLIKKRNSELKYLLFYVLAPLPIIHFALDGHVDGFGLPLFILSILFYFTNKKILSAILLGLSISIKPVGLVLLPIFFLNEKNIINKIKFAIIPFLVFAVQFLPYIFNSNPFEAFLIYTRHWIFNGFVFNIFNSFIHNNQTSRMICGIMLALVLLILYFSKKEIDLKIYFSVLLLMIFSPVVHPWYIAWLAVLIPLTQKWSGIFYVSLSSLTTITVLNYQLYGVWTDYWWVLLIEYLPVIILMIIELFKRELRIA